MPTPCARRAVKEAKEALESAGHKLIPFKPPNMEHIWELLTAIFTADQSSNILKALQGEIIDQSIETNKKLMSLHWSVKAIVRPYLSYVNPSIAKLATSKYFLNYSLFMSEFLYKTLLQQIIH